MLSDWIVPGIGNVQALEDFFVSNNALVLGSLVFVLFCVTKKGWGWEKFLQEADHGSGMRFPRWARLWVKYGVPALILIIFVAGWIPTLQTWMGIG